ncbi:collagen-like protein [Luminiphilus sp.]|nr:collagen-like protein [Luminiphilus sp.]
MTKPLLAILLLLPLSALAQTQVPNVFEDGTPASAAEVNANFDALEAALPPSNCTTDQIIKWNGSAWVCSDPSGAAGPQGEKGDTGDTGPQGETGPAGPQGATGLTGATGAKGDTGDQGIQGEQGPAGADGVAAGLSCTTDQIIKYDGSAWVCASRLSGAITMIDRWYANGESFSNQNMDFEQDSDSMRGVIRGDGNQMAFTAGTGSSHGFSFPETGIYRVDTTMQLRASTETSQSTYVRAQLSFDTATNWSNIGRMTAWNSNFGIENGGQVYMSVSMSFTLNISNTASDRLRFEFNEGNAYSSLTGESRYSWVTFTRIEP